MAFKKRFQSDIWNSITDWLVSPPEREPKITDLGIDFLRLKYAWKSIRAIIYGLATFQKRLLKFKNGN